MNTIKRFIYVDAPPEAINAVGLRTDLLPEWFVGVQGATPSEDFPAEGSTLDVKMRVSGFSFEVTQTVEEYIPGERLAVTISGGVVNAECTWTYTPEGNRTKVSLNYAYDMPDTGGFSFVSRMVDGMMVGNLEKTLRNLKRVAEREAALSRTA